MNEQELVYKERLAIIWLFLWRGFLISCVGGVILGVIIGTVGFVVGLSNEVVIFIGPIGGGLLGLFCLSPLLVSMMMRKSFMGFKLQIVREE